MRFNNHSNLKGAHAFLSASKYHWTNYTPQKLENVYRNYSAARRGTELHDIAEKLINMKIKLPAVPLALNMFVNDAISYRMHPELVLFYSPNAFGTADAISFRDGILRIHDLKTGVSKVSMRQLEVYAALFCLEYLERPETIDIILRVYQGDTIFEHKPEPEDIRFIMDKTVDFDKLIETIKEME